MRRLRLRLGLFGTYISQYERYEQQCVDVEGILEVDVTAPGAITTRFFATPFGGGFLCTARLDFAISKHQENALLAGK